MRSMVVSARVKSSGFSEGAYLCLILQLSLSFMLEQHIGFAWPGFSSRQASGESFLGSCQKLPLCPP